MRKPSHATVVAYLALFFAMTGTAVAATGGTFVLGKSNAESTKASLTNTSGTPLALYAKSGSPALSVNTTRKIARLNADLIDGHSSAFFQRRVSGRCASNNSTAIVAVGSGGSVTCANPLEGTGAMVLSGFVCPPGSFQYGTAEVGNGAGGTDVYYICEY